MEPLSDLEKANVRLIGAKQRIGLLADRIVRMKAAGQSTELYEQLLDTLQKSLVLMQAHVNGLAKSLLCYRCYLLSGGRIQGVRMFEASGDADVLIHAGGFLKMHPEHQEIEIWLGKRKVARLTKP